MKMLRTKQISSVVFPVVAASLLFTGTAGAQTYATAAATNSWPAYYRPFTLPPEAYDPPYRIALFNPGHGEEGARAWSQTKSIFIYAVGAVAVLWVLPEESTGWDSSTDSLLKNWQENVKEGPQWDRDKFAYNYVGHMYFGGVYYQIARKSGYRQWDAFIYTALMSTFVWEYGVEAFAEIPSVQDLFFTPIAGWLYGEWAYQTEFKLRSNGGEVLGSKVLGGLSLFLLDPVDMTGRGVNKLFGRDLIKAGYGFFTYNPVQVNGETDHQVYLHMRMPIGPAGPPEQPEETNYRIHEDDPFTFSIIGFGAGSGLNTLDDKWNVTDDSYTKLSLGLYFTPRISTRFAYTWGEVKEHATKEIIPYETYTCDTQIYLFPRRKFRPYVTGGIGRQVWEEDDDNRTFQWNAGVGAHLQIAPKLAVQADWINYYSPSQSTYDQQISAGVIYRFGEGERQNR
jgi:hypothetical protein